jgi:protein-S-isoprenylcysteine O-methyltransferase Ste14
LILRRLIIFSMLFIWILTEIFGSYLIPKMRRRGVEVKKDDKGSKAFMMFGIITAVIIASLIGSKVLPLPEWVYIVGVGVMILGMALRQWSIAVLGRFFSRSVGVQEGQIIVDKGPYSLIRHPAYTGTIITVLGYAVMERSVLAILVSILICAAIYSYRIHVEEKLLVSKLGDAYVEYSKRTKRLIPYIL